MRTPRPSHEARVLFAATVFLALAGWHGATAADMFNFDYVQSGRVWIPDLVVDAGDIPRSDREVALLGFGDCPADQERATPTLAPRVRDCRFERQVAAVLENSGVFRRVAVVHAAHEATDLVLTPLGSRAEFERRVIPAAKPFLLLTFFTYVWTPLPYERDLETYRLNVAVVDRQGTRLETALVERQYTHTLGSYSADNRPPADLAATLTAAEHRDGRIPTCRGPHAAVAVHALLHRLSETVQGIR